MSVSHERGGANREQGNNDGDDRHDDEETAHGHADPPAGDLDLWNVLVKSLHKNLLEALWFFHLVVNRVHDFSKTLINSILLLSKTRQILAQTCFHALLVSLFKSFFFQILLFIFILGLCWFNGTIIRRVIPGHLRAC